MHRIARWAQTPVTCVASVVLTVLLVGSTGALVSPAAAATICPGAAVAGQVRVAVVVDYGTDASAPAPASVHCLTVAEGSTGAQVLKERADLLGAARPRYAASGLLCALDGYPGGDECGQVQGTSYRYWSYWSGTSGSWVYGTGNPFTRRVRDGDIEGWRFVTASEGQAPPPRVAPDASVLFPPAPAPAPPSGPAVAVPGATPPTSVGEASTAPAAATVGEADAGGGAPAAAGTDPTVADTSDAGSPTTLVAEPAAAVGDQAALGGGPGGAERSGSGVPVSALVGVALVGGLAVAALRRARRTTAP